MGRFEKDKKFWCTVNVLNSKKTDAKSLFSCPYRAPMVFFTSQMKKCLNRLNWTAKVLMSRATAQDREKRAVLGLRVPERRTTRNPEGFWDRHRSMMVWDLGDFFGAEKYFWRYRVDGHERADAIFCSASDYFASAAEVSIPSADFSSI